MNKRFKRRRRSVDLKKGKDITCFPVLHWGTNKIYRHYVCAAVYIIII